MKHTNLRILLLAALLTASLSVIACGGSEVSTPAETTGADISDETDASTETQSPYKLTLPDDLDFGGTDVYIYGWQTYESIEFYAESENGDIVNDSVFRRNQSVEENLNVHLTFSEEGGRSGSEWGQKVSNANKAGDDTYDIVAGHTHRIGELSRSGDLLNLLDYEYLDLEQPWWRSELIERALIRDKLFFVTGDISPSSVGRSQGIFFNTEILHNFDLEDPYQLVIDGTWTHAKMMEMSKGVYIDLNSDGKKDEENDQFGFALDWTQTQAIGLTSGIITIETDSDGYPTLSPNIVTERSTTIIDNWIDFIHHSPDTFLVKQTDDTTIFRNGRALFYSFLLGSFSTDFRDCTFNIGFVPWPKADEDQEDYITTLSNACSLWTIPIAATDPEMSSAVMENLGYEGFRQIMPAVFETAYKIKYNHTESQLQSQVFDILRTNLTFDIGRIMAEATGDVFFLFPDCITGGKNNLASKFETTKKRANKMIEKWIDQIDSMD